MTENAKQTTTESAPSEGASIAEVWVQIAVHEDAVGRLSGKGAYAVEVVVRVPAEAGPRKLACKFGVGKDASDVRDLVARLKKDRSAELLFRLRDGFGKTRIRVDRIEYKCSTAPA